MQKKDSLRRYDALDRAELEEHILVLRLLMSRTYARETHFGRRHASRADFMALITKYTGHELPDLHRAADEDVDDEDDDNGDGSLQRRVYAACQPALRAVERALRGHQRADAIHELCDALAKTLRLTPTHKALLRLALAIQRNSDLRDLCKQIGMLDEDEMTLLCNELLDISKQDLQDAFEAGSPILGNEADGHDYVMKWLHLPKMIEKRLREKNRKGERLALNDFLEGLFNRAPAAKLEPHEFPDPVGEIALLQRYLARLCQAPRAGVNILLYGPPGTGKTQLSRALCQSLGITLFEVPTEDIDRDPLTPQQRLAGFRAAQASAQLLAPAAVHFDEFEDVFPIEGDEFSASLFGSRRNSKMQMKGWINQLLESNPVPAIWVGNCIDGMDAAYLRRFDMIVQVKRPRPAARARIVNELFKTQPLPDDAKRLLAEDSRLAPAHLERMASVLQTLEPNDEAATSQVVRILRGQIVRVINEPSETPKVASRLRYRGECTTADVALDAVIEGIARTGGGRFCLYGPPGTGKTAWVHHVAERIGKPVVLKRASDLLSPFVGITEQLIRTAFDEAEREMAILLIDEADSFLRDRQLARSSWEITQVNELLVNMERFEGIFFASTNLFGDLDEASLRRFDFKIRFGYLQTAQALSLLRESLRALDLEPDVDAATMRRLERLDRLTPGDFASVVRRFSIHAADRTAAAFVEALTGEIVLRRKQEPRRVGFV